MYLSGVDAAVSDLLLIFQGLSAFFRKKIWRKPISAIHNSILYFYKNKVLLLLRTARSPRSLRRTCPHQPLENHKHNRADERAADSCCRHPHGICSDPAEASQLSQKYRHRIHRDVQKRRSFKRAKLLIQIREHKSQQESINCLCCVRVHK